MIPSNRRRRAARLTRISEVRCDVGINHFARLAAYDVTPASSPDYCVQHGRKRLDPETGRYRCPGCYTGTP